MLAKAVADCGMWLGLTIVHTDLEDAMGVVWRAEDKAKLQRRPSGLSKNMIFALELVFAVLYMMSVVVGRYRSSSSLRRMLEDQPQSELMVVLLLRSSDKAERTLLATEYHSQRMPADHTDMFYSYAPRAFGHSSVPQWTAWSVSPAEPRSWTSSRQVFWQVSAAIYQYFHIILVFVVRVI